METPAWKLINLRDTTALHISNDIDLYEFEERSKVELLEEEYGSFRYKFIEKSFQENWRYS